jgi:hypothetical protein
MAAVLRSCFGWQRKNEVFFPSYQNLGLSYLPLMMLWVAFVSPFVFLRWKPTVKVKEIGFLMAVLDSDHHICRLWTPGTIIGNDIILYL